MLIRQQPPLHLTYCLNVHPGEAWEENFLAISTHAVAVRDLVAPGKRFGLGLRLSRNAAGTLMEQPETMDRFRHFLSEQDLYVFSINGFPYGAFHGMPVKTAVYRPDWSDPERLEYTRMLADILSALLPEGVDGSISTVPLAYGRHRRTGAELACFVEHLAGCVALLHALRRRTGRLIHLGLEPEPDCMLESTEDVLRFFAGPLRAPGLKMLGHLLACSRSEAESVLLRHLGVCFDTCHLALRFEDLAGSLMRLTSMGIRVSKVQLSAAIEASPDAATLKRLGEFCEPVYLHQVSTRAARSGEEDRFSDLDKALACPRLAADETWRIHFHVPLYFAGDREIRSTATALTPGFWSTLAAGPVAHLEIETYTFHVLPKPLQAGGVENSIAQEFEWVLRRLARDGVDPLTAMGRV